MWIKIKGTNYQITPHQLADAFLYAPPKEKAKFLELVQLSASLSTVFQKQIDAQFKKEVAIICDEYKRTHKTRQTVSPKYVINKLGVEITEKEFASKCRDNNIPLFELSGYLDLSKI